MTKEEITLQSILDNKMQFEMKLSELLRDFKVQNGVSICYINLEEHSMPVQNYESVTWFEVRSEIKL